MIRRILAFDWPGALRALGVIGCFVAVGMAWAGCERRTGAIAFGPWVEKCWECNAENCWEVPCEPTASPESAEIAL